VNEAVSRIRVWVTRSDNQQFRTGDVSHLQAFGLLFAPIYAQVHLPNNYRAQELRQPTEIRMLNNEEKTENESIKVEIIDVAPESNSNSEKPEMEIQTTAVEIEIAEEPVVESQESKEDSTLTEESVVDAPSPETVQPVVAEETTTKKPVSSESKEVSDEVILEASEVSENKFAELNLSDDVLESVLSSGYDTPTPIQAQIIPHVLSGRDVLAQSQTGSGKTAAFALPILSNLESKRPKKPKVLVLAPTRELAIQVARSFSTYGKNLPDFSVAAIYGGQSYEPQLKQLRRGVHVVVGTPGRVIDHINRGTLDLSGIECLVLDEADEMLNMGFLDDVEFVLKHAPKKRQIALFSATLPKPIRNISERYLDNPAKVTIKQKSMTADSIRQRAVLVHQRDKVDLLIKFLEAEQADGVIVFTRTRDTTTQVAEKLFKHGLSAVALNGDMPQNTRERTIQRLKSGQLDILVATDVAARGLDVSRISHVFNFDLPENPEIYTHRVGRTGRAGRKGEAIIFLSPSQKGRLRFIEKVTKQKIEIVDAPSANEINSMRIQRFKEQIGKTIEEQDLGFYQKMIGEYAETSDHSYEMIAAAIAMMGQKGRDFLMKDRPARKKRERNDRTERGDRNDRGRRGSRDRFGGSPDKSMTRYRIAVGKRDGVKPGNIVGAVANEAGIDGGDIGPIRIQESYSTIDLPKNLSREIIEILEDAWVSGRQLKIRPARDDDSRSSSRSGSRRKGRPNDQPSSGPRGGRKKSSDFRGKRKSKPGSTVNRKVRSKKK
jgi:ATP-dependent RNA helicase DeaD